MQDDISAAPSPTAQRRLATGEFDQKPFTNSPELLFDSPLTNAPSVPSPNSAPLEWYDLLAEDAINNIDKYNLNLDLERTTLSRRQSFAPDAQVVDPQLQAPEQDQKPVLVPREQWNSPEKLPLSTDELMLFHHYVDVIGPSLDLCDPTKQFTNTVPSLAVHNVGVLKSLLALAARHLAVLNGPWTHQLPSDAPTLEPKSHRSSSQVSPFLQIATHYYYETLQYLSKNLLYPSYSRSREIISTALLISTYVRTSHTMSQSYRV